MDSTNPDLSAFKARGGKLIIVEHMADYAQSPYAGIGYFQSVQKKMGAAAVGSLRAPLHRARRRSRRRGAPANVDMLKVLVDWVEGGKAPGDLVVTEQTVGEPGHDRARAAAVPVAEWPKYKQGDAKKAESFVCAP